MGLIHHLAAGRELDGGETTPAQGGREEPCKSPRTDWIRREGRAGRGGNHRARAAQHHSDGQNTKTRLCEGHFHFLVGRLRPFDSKLSRVARLESSPNTAFTSLQQRLSFVYTAPQSATRQQIRSLEIWQLFDRIRDRAFRRPSSVNATVSVQDIESEDYFTRNAAQRPQVYEEGRSRRQRLDGRDAWGPVFLKRS